ncbi:hypothetical protein CA951_31180 [Rhodococcus sp. NCIMB 12038]|nr:hypothetical protein CA951_31180 [Rhodococcus sp. NCIMB 12038]
MPRYVLSHLLSVVHDLMWGREEWFRMSVTYSPTDSTTRVRSWEPFQPNGCRWCGSPERTHGYVFARSVGFHAWAEPTVAQRKARMKAR